MTMNNKSQKRIKDLFDTVSAAMSDAPNGHEPSYARQTEAVIMNSREAALEQEVTSLQARVRELEQHLKTQEIRPLRAPIVYEKEEVGFAFSDDKVLPVSGIQPIVTNEAEMLKTPLIAAGKSIGEVKIAQPFGHPLSDEDVKLANAIAQQAALQIENLRLLAAAERARTEAEEATKQYAHKSWDNFLDAIHQAERIGYQYNQSAVELFEAPKPQEYDHEEVMQTLNMQIGKLFVKGNQSLTEEDRRFIGAVANQVGQQVENIRLLADASRARAEAEEATRRLTRQNWETYTEREGGMLGFVYDSVKVSPLNEPAKTQTVLEQPLYVRGEAIGQLAVAGLPNVSPEARELAASIAAQTSIHLETLRLTEELQKRAQELKELDRLKSAFLANMSHELRTPLNSILGFTDVMLEGLDGELTPYMDNDLRLIQKNGQHLLSLINDVLDMAKIESGRMNLLIEPCNLHEVIDDVMRITSSLANEKRIALHIEPDSDKDVVITADRTRLRQVLINLVNNSIKFTNTGYVSVMTVRDESNVILKVKDTGVGIPPAELESIFQEFTQVDTSTTRKVGGTGLGLPISRRLIQMHGGRLWGESSGIDGEGATFYVILPIEAKVSEPEEITTRA